MDNLIRYSIKLALLNQLISKNKITRKEYEAIKDEIIKTCKIKNSLS
ncbi:MULTISPECIES: conjugal transfer protein [Clostridium]|nr:MULTISPECIES: conjugal transfer protein [Clostridium]UZQ48948.1 conjugal transfer protein [Clostridium kluyveri]